MMVHLKMLFLWPYSKKIYSYSFDIRSQLYNYYEQNGCVREARLKEHVKIDDKFYDVVIHSKYLEELYE